MSRKVKAKLLLLRRPFSLFFTGITQVVTIDLKGDCLTPGKKNYQRIRNSLDKQLDDTFDVVVSWDSLGNSSFIRFLFRRWFDLGSMLINVLLEFFRGESVSVLGSGVVSQTGIYGFAVSSKGYKTSRIFHRGTSARCRLRPQLLRQVLRVARSPQYWWRLVSIALYVY